jgi:PhnB protein
MAAHKPEEWVRLFAQHLNAGDLEAVIALYEPDASFVPRSGDTVVGRSGIRQVLADFIAKKPQMRGRVTKVVPTGDIALLYTDWQGTAVDPAGTPVEIFHQAIEIVRRQADGTWKLLVGHPDGRGSIAEGASSGHHTVTPYLTIKDAARALEFYKTAFGATEIFRLSMPDGRLGHAEIRLGDSVIMLSDEFPEYGGVAPHTLGGSPVNIHLYVKDVDAFVKRAVAAGAKELKPVMDQFYGDRSGQLEDPFGHLWWVATHKEEIAADEMQRRVQALFAEKK